jgi:hypothetical protein
MTETVRREVACRLSGVDPTLAMLGHELRNHPAVASLRPIFVSRIAVGVYRRSLGQPGRRESRPRVSDHHLHLLAPTGVVSRSVFDVAIVQTIRMDNDGDISCSRVPTKPAGKLEDIFLRYCLQLDRD